MWRLKNEPRYIEKSLQKNSSEWHYVGTLKPAHPLSASVYGQLLEKHRIDSASPHPDEINKGIASRVDITGFLEVPINFLKEIGFKHEYKDDVFPALGWTTKEYLQHTSGKKRGISLECFIDQGLLSVKPVVWNNALRFASYGDNHLPTKTVTIGRGNSDQSLAISLHAIHTYQLQNQESRLNWSVGKSIFARTHNSVLQLVAVDSRDELVDAEANITYSSSIDYSLPTETDGDVHPSSNHEVASYDATEAEQASKQSEPLDAVALTKYEPARSTLQGRSLFEFAESEYVKGTSEISICLMAGYATEEIIKFRGEIAKERDVPLGSLSRMLLVDAESTGNLERVRVEGSINRYKRDATFRSRIFERHGIQCICCGLSIEPLLEAAHIRAVYAGGSDHGENGLPLCANHHLAFDKLLWCIDPYTGRIVVTPGYCADSLGITKSHVELRLGKENIEFAWRVFRG